MMQKAEIRAETKKATLSAIVIDEIQCVII